MNADRETAYIRGNPADFKNAYWLLNSVKVYQQS
jgi:hypothetical protein